MHIFSNNHFAQRLLAVANYTGSSRMKGGSMTAILLNTIFSLALSRAYSIPLSTLLGVPELCAPSHNPVPGSNDMKNGMEDGGSCCHILTEGEEQAALVLDAFQATYSAAYRSDITIRVSMAYRSDDGKGQHGLPGQMVTRISMTYRSDDG